MAQSVEQLTLGFHSGHDIGVLGASPTQTPHSEESLLEFLFPSSFTLPPTATSRPTLSFK